MPTEVITALIAGLVSFLCTLVTAIGAFQTSVRKDREKAKDELKAELIKYHEKNKEEIKEIREKDLREIRDDVSALGANLQSKIAILELSLNHTREDIVTLSNRVEKHNNFGERIYHLEDADKLLDEKISVANHRIADLENKK